MIKSWTDEAWEDFEYWTRQDKKTLKRILQLLKDIDRNGYDGIGKPAKCRIIGVDVLMIVIDWYTE